MRTAKQRAAIAKWKIVQRGLIQPKLPAPAESWWLSHPARKGFTDRAKAEQARMQGSSFGSICKQEEKP